MFRPSWVFFSWFHKNTANDFRDIKNPHAAASCRSVDIDKVKSIFIRWHQLIYHHFPAASLTPPISKRFVIAYLRLYFLCHHKPKWKSHFENLMSFMVFAGKILRAGGSPTAKKNVGLKTVAVCFFGLQQKHLEIKCATWWIEMDRSGSHSELAVTYACKQNTRTSTHPHAGNQSSALLSIHISIAGPPDVNKLGNPILYIFQACQSVTMKCCLLPLGKFLLSFLAKRSSGFISPSMNRCVGMKRCVTCQIWCYFQKFSDHPQMITSSFFSYIPTNTPLKPPGKHFTHTVTVFWGSIRWETDLCWGFF